MVSFCRSIETGALSLAFPPPPLSDAAILDLFSDPTILELIPALRPSHGGRWTPADVAARREWQETAVQAGSAWPCAVFLRSSGECVGVSGLRSIDLPQRTGEMGIILSENVRRAGLAARIHLAVLGHVFEECNCLPLEKVVFRTSPENQAMRRFFEQFGIAFCGVSDGDTGGRFQFAEYSLTRDQWHGGIKQRLSAFVQSKDHSGDAAAVAL